MCRLLLCPPKHYGIEYEINPWMDQTRGAQLPVAQSQWNALKDQLAALGCQIELVEAQAHLPDMVFTANAGLVVGKTFFRSNFRFPQRRSEEPHFQEWFARRGYDVVPLPEAMFFEGEGDALFCGDVLVCGYRFRSDIQSHQELGRLLNCLVVSVELVQERFYHLDTCFCPLPSGSAIWFSSAFDSYAQQALRRHVLDLIEVAPEEAARFACNAIPCGKDIVLPEGCPELASELRHRGYRPYPLAMSEFLKSGGACKCLVLRLPQREKMALPSH